jgi:hypothetical protein
MVEGFMVVWSRMGYWIGAGLAVFVLLGIGLIVLNLVAMALTVMFRLLSRAAAAKIGEKKGGLR